MKGVRGLSGHKTIVYSNVIIEKHKSSKFI